MEYVHESHGIADHQHAGTVPSNQLREEAFICPPNWAPFIESLTVSTPKCDLMHQAGKLLATQEEFVVSNGRSEGACAVNDALLSIYNGTLMETKENVSQMFVSMVKQIEHFTQQ